MNRLSARLTAIVGMVPEEAVSQTVADVGTDHAFVPVSLLLNGKISRAIAMDINPGPLSRAEEHIEKEGLSSVAETRLSDGLCALKPGEVEGCIITGMGGDLMLRILEADEEVRRSVNWWVFSPQSELLRFRHGIEDMGLCITRETMVKDDGKYYTIMLARPGCMHYGQEEDYRYGALLIKDAPPVFKEFIAKEKERIMTALCSLEASEKDAAKERRRVLEEEKKEIDDIYDRFKGSDKGT